MKNVIHYAVLISIWACGIVYAQPAAPKFIDPAVNNETNLHFSGKYCTECHLSAPEVGEPPNLRFGKDYIQSCRCHGYLPDTYIHPVYVKPSANKKIKIPADMPLQDGLLSCATCHDIGLQCKKDPQTQWQNKSFLRGAPYDSRTGICRRCHEQGNYKMLDPHNQIDYDGQVIKETCLYCHVEAPDAEHSAYLAGAPFPEKVQLIGDLTAVCSRCHPAQGKLHPINVDHFRKPTPEILATMSGTEKRLGTILPLDSKGHVTCATCHNPHEKGVIPAGRIAARGASEIFRLRVPGWDKDIGTFGFICGACHNK